MAISHIDIDRIATLNLVGRCLEAFTAVGVRVYGIAQRHPSSSLTGNAQRPTSGNA